MTLQYEMQLLDELPSKSLPWIHHFAVMLNSWSLSDLRCLCNGLAHVSLDHSLCKYNIHVLYVI